MNPRRIVPRPRPSAPLWRRLPGFPLAMALPLMLGLTIEPVVAAAEKSSVGRGRKGATDRPKLGVKYKVPLKTKPVPTAKSSSRRPSKVREWPGGVAPRGVSIWCRTLGRHRWRLSLIGKVAIGKDGRVQIWGRTPPDRKRLQRIVLPLVKGGIKAARLGGRRGPRGKRRARKRKGTIFPADPAFGWALQRVLERQYGFEVAPLR